MLHEEVEDTVGTITAIKKIANDVDALHSEPFDEHAERLNKVCSAADLHNRLDELFIVIKLCLVQLRTCAQ